MTEGNTSVTLHNDTWDKITATFRLLNNPTTHAIAKNIEMQVPHLAPVEWDEPDHDTVAVGFCGLPGAGKSHAADLFAEKVGGEAISMGDAIRENASPRVRGSSKLLAEFASEQRTQEAERIPRWVTDLCEDGDATVFAIDGVRSVTDYEVLSDYFDRFLLVHVQADFYTRLERVTERGREGEDEFDGADLYERDQRELDELGFRGLRDGGDEWAEEFLPNPEYNQYDTGFIGETIENEHDLGDLDAALSIVAEKYDWLPEPRPVDLKT